MSIIWVGPVRLDKRRKSKPKPRPTPTLAKSIDFILVYNVKDVVGEVAASYLETFLLNLVETGLEVESVPFSLDNNVTFVKIHAPRDLLIRYAEIFSLELTFQNVYFRPKPPMPLRFMATEVTMGQVDSPVLKRARHGMVGTPLQDLTTAERGLIVYNILTVTEFGKTKEEKGIERLLEEKVFETAYPLHDGPYEWTKDGTLNDRQLLKKYWSSIRCWYKQQPLDVIERYFGPETAFYFAWLGLYNKMLIPAAVVGVASVIVGTAIFQPDFQNKSEEICNSDAYTCPRCLVQHCKYGQLKNSCFVSYLVQIFDNPLSATFAALMSVWSTLFLELWRREEVLLQIRWNVRFVGSDFSMRPEFEKTTEYRRKSKVTGAMEAYVPKSVMCCRYTVSGSLCLFLVLLVIVGLLGVMIYVKTITIVLMYAAETEVLTKNIATIAASTGTLISVAFTLSFELIYRKITMWLTVMENPRTQAEFDKAFTFKSYALAFVTHYTVIFYLAFVKTRFYTYPGDDEKLHRTLGGLGSDLCGPTGCIIEIGIQLVVTLFAKNLVMTARQYIVPQVMVCLRKLQKKRHWKNTPVTAQWEQDYLLIPAFRYNLLEEYLQMIIQYGFVIFFVAAFPLAPLLALFNNLIELRVDALKFTCTYRRPIAYKVGSIGAWNAILQGVTYIGVATNAFVIAFTSELVQREMYRKANGGLVGFLNSSLSLYNVSEFPSTFYSPQNISMCYYPGTRHPPDHPNRYQLTGIHWYQLAIKFLTVIIFEHVVIFLTGIITCMVPDMPDFVKKHISYQKDKLREMKLKEFKDRYLRQQQDRESIFTLNL